MSRRPDSFENSLFLFIFAIPFTAVGLGAMIWLWSDVLRSREILASWTTVPATIESTELLLGRGRRSSGYRVEATYSYVFSGETFRSQSVGIWEGTDNFGDYQRTLYGHLTDSMRFSEPTACYVNPRSPSEAILRPQLRPEIMLFKSLFAVAFGLGGFGGMILAPLGLFKKSSDLGLKARYPDEPWRWRAAWKSPVLYPQLKKWSFVSIAALVWGHAGTLPLWSTLPAAWSAPSAYTILVTPALIGVLVLSAWCLRTIWRARRFSDARLELGSLPLRPGSTVKAQLYLPHAIPPGAKVELSLICWHHMLTGKRKRRPLQTINVWSKRHTVPGPIAAREALDFACHLPADVEETSLDSRTNLHDWTFEAKSNARGAVVDLRFELPVFATRTPMTS